MILPEELIPTDKLTVSLPSGAMVDLPVCRPVFHIWLGKKPDFDLGNKPLVYFNQTGVFVEIYILKLFTCYSDWKGVWVETYGGIHFLKDMPTSWKLAEHNVPIPEEKEALLRKIWKKAKTTACFDIFVWKGNDILFCEAKHKGQDKLTDGQLKFIEGALACGIPADNLLICEWDIENIFERKEVIESLREFGEVLRGIHNRLVKEGKVKVVDGKALFLNEKTGEWLDGEAMKNKRKNI